MWDVVDVLLDVVVALVRGGLRAVGSVRNALNVQQRNLQFRRRARGQCQKCGYDLTGNVSGRCPECGEVVAGGRHGNRR